MGARSESDLLENPTTLLCNEPQDVNNGGARGFFAAYEDAIFAPDLPRHEMGRARYGLFLRRVRGSIHKILLEEGNGPEDLERPSHATCSLIRSVSREAKPQIITVHAHERAVDR